ncbi:DUF2279 domain-containing protein [Catenovulum sediminis]|uniref:DUF2279 domain-containing protein n=1 Tax=Catenovulum sediminis TaxID=1740262 RepID=A0ABV1RF67_9ALTE|nr:DUF2279 domain-containing protein [Catenovulum sediminis]
MKYRIFTLLVLLSFFTSARGFAQPTDSVNLSAIQPDYRDFWHASEENWLEIGALFGGITYLGLKEWDWGSSKFKFNGEGWFGMDTGSGGADKLGHLYSTYAMSEFLSHRMMDKGYSAQSSALYSVYAASALMLYVEVFDGYSGDHGFSYQDLVANTVGAGVSYFKTIYPHTLGDTLDLRIEYSPSKGMEGFHPVTDYSGMKYLAVAKLNGIDALKKTPLRFFELQLGYFTRGFAKNDRPFTDYRTTETFVGISINLDELLFKPYEKQLGQVGQYIRAATHYVQVPGISLRTDIAERRKGVN